MFSYLAAPGFQPFSIAGLVLIGLLGVEVVSLMFGHSLAGLIDTLLPIEAPDLDLDAGIEAGVDVGVDVGVGVDADIDSGTGLDIHSGGGVFGTVFDWLNAGRVPVLVLLMAAIGSFAVFGLAIQIVAMHVVGPLPTPIAAGLAIAAAIPSTRWTSQVVARIVPRDETYAVGNADLVGRTGVVTLGPVEAKSAGRAKVQDKYGNWHFPRVRPARADLVIPQGATILVVDQADNELTVVPAEGRLA